jgi:hypothetical protein
MTRDELLAQVCSLIRIRSDIGAAMAAWLAGLRKSRGLDGRPGAGAASSAGETKHAAIASRAL